MTFCQRFLTVIILALPGAPSLAAPVQPIEWSTLPNPAAQVFEDPFRDLNDEQADDIRFALRLRGRLQQDVGSAEERQKWQEMLDETEAALAADQIDIDWLMSQREAVIQRREIANTTGNPVIDDQIVSIVGYVIPVAPDEQGRAVAYLVPQPGMCSHLPPPPPNQMIRLLLSDHWAPDSYYDHVSLTGRLAIEPTEYETFVIDGQAPMRATFSMEVQQVELLGSGEDQFNEFLTLHDRLRAALRSKSSDPADSP
ncbi:DUF3299 domain-containing protein [Ruegeria sp. SCPT10]|uniref:DUF3299 domain-containing protein n=1 Tax=Ruegeria sp. SCP10 TaxID=3141377 RepID=UPI003338B6AF